MPTKQNERSRSLPRVVYILAGSIFLLGTTEFMIAGLLPDMSRDLQVSVPVAGLLISAFAVGMVVGAPLMAALTLRLPPRTTMTVALAVFAAGHVAAALSDSFGVILAARVITALATGAFWAVAAVAVVAAAGSADRARALGVLVGGLTVATVAGVPLGSALGQALGWRSPFWILAVLSVAAAIAVLATVAATPPGRQASRIRDEVAALRSGRLWLVLLTAALAQAGVFGAFSYVAPLLTEQAGLPERAVPLVLAGFGVGAFLGSSTGGRYGDRYPWGVVALALAGTTVVLIGVGSLASTPLAVIGLVAVLGFTGFVVAAPLTARVIALAGSAPTLASATATSAFNVGNAVGPWLGGVAIGAGAGLAAPAMVGAALAIAALVVWSLTRTTASSGTATSVEPASAPRPLSARDRHRS